MYGENGVEPSCWLGHKCCGACMPLIGRAAAHYLDNSITTDNISLHVGASYALLPDSSCRQLVCKVRQCMTVRVMAASTAQWPHCQDAIEQL